MPTVTNTLKAPDGSLVSTASVQIELAGTDGVPIKGYVTAGDYSFIGYHQPTVTNGVWSVSLVANSLINPAGTRWKVSETYNSRTHIYYLSVPDGAGPYFVEDILSEAPGTLASAALTAHIATYEAQQLVQTVPIISATTVALGTTAAAISGSNVYFDPADFVLPSGYTAQARLVCLFTGATVGDTLYADVYDTGAAATVLNGNTVVADTTGLVRLVGSWQTYPTVVRRGSIRSYNVTAARGNFRTAWVELQVIENP